MVVLIGWQLVVSLLANISLRYSSRAGLLKPDLNNADVGPWLRLAFVGFVIWIAALIAALFIGAAALAFPAVLLATGGTSSGPLGFREVPVSFDWVPD